MSLRKFILVQVTAEEREHLRRLAREARLSMSNYLRAKRHRQMATQIGARRV